MEFDKLQKGLMSLSEYVISKKRVCGFLQKVLCDYEVPQLVQLSKSCKAAGMKIVEEFITNQMLMNVFIVVFVT